jgi:hypothetical protein
MRQGASPGNAPADVFCPLFTDANLTLASENGGQYQKRSNHFCSTMVTTICSGSGCAIIVGTEGISDAEAGADAEGKTGAAGGVEEWALNDLGVMRNHRAPVSTV